MHRITCFVGVNRLFDLTYCLIFLSPFYRSKVNTFLPSFILLSRCFFLSACFDVHSLCFVGVNRLFDLTYCLIFLSPFYRSKVNTFLPSFKLLSRCFFLSACFDVHSLCFVGVNRLFDLTYCLIFLSPFYRSKVNTFFAFFHTSIILLCVLHQSHRGF
jgi:5-methylthioribose kinase